MLIRAVVAAVALAAATLAGAAAGSSAAPHLTVSIAPSTPRQVASRAAVGRKTFDVTFRVAVSSDERCANLTVLYSYAATFDGRPSLAGSESDSYQTNQPTQSASFTVHASGRAADVITVKARAECEDENGTVAAASSRAASIVVPPHSCEQGPLRVSEVRGAVRREDLVSPRRRVAVRRGDYLWTGYRVWLGKRSRMTYGAAECRGLRVTVAGARTFVPGDYSRASYGAAARLGPGGIVDFRGDQHSGGVETLDAIALARGPRGGPSRVARFQIVSFARRLGRVARVRVQRGSIYVAGRRGRGRYSKPLIAGAGRTVFISCSSRRSCSPTG